MILYYEIMKIKRWTKNEKGVPSLGLLFSSSNSVNLKIFCDSNWDTWTINDRF